jgi:hypothetical protein
VEDDKRMGVWCSVVSAVWTQQGPWEIGDNGELEARDAGAHQIA